MATLPPTSSRRLIKWCMAIAALSMIIFPLGIFGLAVWKYKTDIAAQSTAAKTPLIAPQSNAKP